MEPDTTFIDAVKAWLKPRLEDSYLRATDESRNLLTSLSALVGYQREEEEYSKQWAFCVQLCGELGCSTSARDLHERLQLAGLKIVKEEWA